MEQTIVQITFKVQIPRDAFVQAVMEDAPRVAAVDGLQWKIWSLNDANQEFCGTYLFTTEAAADAYINGPIIAHIKEAPIFSNVTARKYGVIESLTSVTRGPVKESTTA